MQMFGICIGCGYADAWHMDIYNICHPLSFSAEIRKLSDPVTATCRHLSETTGGEYRQL